MDAGARGGHDPKLACSLNHSLRSKRFRGVEKQRVIEERDFRCFSRPKIGRKPKTRKEGEGIVTSTLPPPLSFFGSHPISRAGK